MSERLGLAVQYSYAPLNLATEVNLISPALWGGPLSPLLGPICE